MKKLILGLLAVCLIASVSAQNGSKDYRKATRALGAFNLDPENNKAKLSEAVTEIESALKDSETAAEAKTWQAKGEIYNTIANQIVVATQLGKEDAGAGLPDVEEPAKQAAEAFLKAAELAEKRYETKDAMEGLRNAQTNLSNMGIFAFEAQNYEAAFENFKLVLDAHKVLDENKESSALEEEENYLNQLYITGLAALNAEKEADAEAYFQELYKVQYKKPAIYEALYKIQSAKGDSEENLDKAYAYLEEGRKANPDDVSLLFAEINHFLRIGKLDQLIDKLKKAIEKEPDNVSLYSTLGNVYDNLYQKELDAGNEEKSQEYFAEAKKYYEQAMEKDPTYSDAVYSLGALYYNRAAAMTQELNKYADDYSKEGLKKYDELKKSIFSEFDKALPYFKKAESLNPNDANTLIALKEIYARKDDLKMSNEFKERLEKVQGGGSNDAPYFNE
jgi:tetratricopeptide (TPR) repeat protein